jgi:hypothetical protein
VTTYEETTETDTAPTDPPGEELARTLAERIRTNAGPGVDGIPAPNAPENNNPFGFVRSANEMAAGPTPIAVTHDARRFAFARRDSGVSSIWMANADGSSARKLFDLATDRAKLPEDRGVDVIGTSALLDLQFSRDDRYVYFQTDGWQTSLALYRVDVRTGKTSFVVDATGYSVIGQCEKDRALEGSLVAYRRSYTTLLGEAFEAYFLLDAQGRQRGVVGQDPEKVTNFLTTRCSGHAPNPLPTSPRIDPKLKSFPECGTGVLRYAPVRFLDGTELPIFYVVKKPRAHAQSLSLDDADSPPLRLDEVLEGFEANCGTSRSRK